MKVNLKNGILMEINFSRTKLQKVFNSEAELKKAYGEQARIIMRRMVMLRAASNLSDVSHLPPVRRHELTGELQNHFAIDLKQPFRLLFKPNHDPVPKKKDGGIDLENVTAITITEIKDYH